MTGFKGVQNKNGRPIGSVNKTTIQIRESYRNLIEDNIEQIKKDLKTLEPKDRLQFLLHLSRFILPTLRSVELDANTAESKFTPIEVTIIGSEEYEEISKNLEARY